MYSDSSGECVLIAGLIGAAISVIFNGINNTKNNRPFFEGAVTMAFKGFMVGAINSILTGITPFKTSFGLFDVGITPNFMYSSDGVAFGATVFADYNITSWLKVGGEASAQYYTTTTGTKQSNMWQYTLGYGFDAYKGNWEAGLYSNHYWANDGSSQRNGGLRLGYKDFEVRYENDGVPFSNWAGDGGDGYRTAAVKIGYGDFEARMLLYTGDYASATHTDGYSSTYPNEYYVGGNVDKYRMGVLSLGYKGFRVGASSERFRHAFQNQFAHGLIAPQPGFKMLNSNFNPYFYMGTNSRYSLWY
jgi:hypothetical protein